MSLYFKSEISNLLFFPRLTHMTVSIGPTMYFEDDRLKMTDRLRLSILTHLVVNLKLLLNRLEIAS